MMRRPPRSTLFPYRRSSDLPLIPGLRRLALRVQPAAAHEAAAAGDLKRNDDTVAGCELRHRRPDRLDDADRKSTRLNSSHANISYAVFCLKKKKNVQQPIVV